MRIPRAPSYRIEDCGGPFLFSSRASAHERSWWLMANDRIFENDNESTSFVYLRQRYQVASLFLEWDGLKTASCLVLERDGERTASRLFHPIRRWMMLKTCINRKEVSRKLLQERQRRVPPLQFEMERGACLSDLDVHQRGSVLEFSTAFSQFLLISDWFTVSVMGVWQFLVKSLLLQMIFGEESYNVTATVSIQLHQEWVYKSNIKDNDNEKLLSILTKIGSNTWN